MKNLHEITPTLPDRILSEIWAIRNYYPSYGHILVKMNEYIGGDEGGGRSNLYLTHKTVPRDKPYNWMWEGHLKKWEAFGRPVLLDDVGIIY